MDPAVGAFFPSALSILSQLMSVVFRKIGTNASIGYLESKLKFLPAVSLEVLRNAEPSPRRNGRVERAVLKLRATALDQKVVLRLRAGRLGAREVDTAPVTPPTVGPIFVGFTALLVPAFVISRYAAFLQSSVSTRPCFRSSCNRTWVHWRDRLPMDDADGSLISGGLPVYVLQLSGLLVVGPSR